MGDVSGYGSGGSGDSDGSGYGGGYGGYGDSSGDGDGSGSGWGYGGYGERALTSYEVSAHKPFFWRFILNRLASAKLLSTWRAPSWINQVLSALPTM